MKEGAVSGEVRTALGYRGLFLVRPGLVVLGSVGECLEHQIMAVRLNDEECRSQIGFGQLVHQAVRLLSGSS